MSLDIATLMVAGALVAALAAFLLVGAWLLLRDRALAWWATASAVHAVGIFLLAAGVLAVDTTRIALGGALAAVAPALVWAGTRVFVGRRVTPLVLLAGTVVMVATALFAPAEIRPIAGRTAGLLAWVAYLSAASADLWRCRGERLRSRWPLIAVFLAHAFVFLGGIVDSLIGSSDLAGVPLALGSWFGLIHFESMFYSMGTAIFMVVICKERSELQLRIAAAIDALTGAASRGAFMVEAARLFARARTEASPLTVIVVDLDRFKSINDTHGHPVGDRVLATFAETARKLIRPADLLGRHGGEEFAIVLPGATIETGRAIAERIRNAFPEACRGLDVPIAATLSAGVAALSADTGFDALLGRADAALYRAKNLGRNRVECAEEDGRAPASNVIRVA